MKVKSAQIVKKIEEARLFCLNAIQLSRKERIIKWVLCLRIKVLNTLLFIIKLLLFKKGKPNQIQQIVVFTAGILGDNIIFAGAISALKERFQDAKITVITNCQHYAKNGSEVLSHLPFVDRQLLIEDNFLERQGMTFRIVNPLLNPISCDLFVNFSPFGRRGWIGAVVREMILARLLKARWAIGFKITSPQPRPENFKILPYFCVNEPLCSVSVLKEIGLSPLQGEQSIPVNQQAQESINELLLSSGLDQGRKYFVVNPGAKNKCKCWSPEKFGQIASWLAETYNFTPVLIGSKSNTTQCDETNQASGNRCLNLVGKTDLPGLIELIRSAELCITNDTGPMHISGCLEKPTVGIFSARRSPENWFPQGEKSIVVFSIPECAFCNRDSYQEDEYPVQCLENIQPEDVKKAVLCILPNSM